MLTMGDPSLSGQDQMVTGVPSQKGPEMQESRPPRSHPCEAWCIVAVMWQQPLLQTCLPITGTQSSSS